MVDIGAKLDVVTALDPGEVVSNLVTLFHALNEGEWFASEEREARDVYRYVTATRGTREVIQQPATRILVMEIVDFVCTQNPCVLCAKAAIMVVLSGGTRESVLTEVLVLGVDLNAGHITGAQAAAKHDLVAGAEFMINTQRVNVSRFRNRIVADLA